MRNPWVDLNEGPEYVLDCDRPYAEAFNRLEQRAQFQLALDLVPIPFMGDKQAPLVLLALNPSFEPERRSSESGTAPRGRALLRTIRDECANPVHVGLCDEFSDSYGSRWWRRCFNGVRKAGIPFAELAERVLTVEFHGYRSRESRAIPVTLPSQLYGFHLVREAISRRAVVVVARGRRYWEVAVPELHGYERRVDLRNPRSTTVSIANCGEEGFARVLSSLEGRA